MVFRLILALAAVSLVVAGCNTHRPAGKPTRTLASKSHKQQVALRGLAPIPISPSRSTADRGYVARAHIQPANAGNAAPYTLGPGDRVRVTVFGQDNLSRVYPVDASGFVSMPLIGAVNAGGATTFQVEDRIASALRQKYVKDPKVTVEVEAHRPFFILGEVRNGGQYPYVAGMTAETAVAIAGGYTARAKKNSVQLSRPANGRVITRMVPATWKVLPGDTITVKERFF